MKKTTFYGLFIFIPAFLMVGYRYFLNATEQAFFRGEFISETWAQALYVLLPTFVIIILVSMALYSTKFMKEMNFRLIALVCFAVYLALSISQLFSTVLIDHVPGITYLLQDFPKYAGFYGGILLYSIFHKK